MYAVMLLFFAACHSSDDTSVTDTEGDTVSDTADSDSADSDTADTADSDSGDSDSGDSDSGDSDSGDSDSGDSDSGDSDSGDSDTAEVDADRDGYTAGTSDCDDSDPAVHPDATEVCDAVDNDCDGLIDDLDPDVEGRSSYYRDNDADGYGDIWSTRLTCTDPGAGWSNQSGDCRDNDPSANPAAEEVCDLIDNDCDGDVNEGFATQVYYSDGDGDGYGGEPTEPLCTQLEGTVTIEGDCDDRNALVNPAVPEVCDGVDNDCDGAIDEDSGC